MTNRPLIHAMDFFASTLAEKKQHEESCSPCRSTRSTFFKHMDCLGVGASSICAVHCFLMPFVLTGLSMIGVHFIQHDATHMVLASLVLFFCLMAIVPGYKRHGNKRVVATMFAGVSLVMFATFFAESMFGERGEFLIMTLGNVLVITAHLLNRKHTRLVSAVRVEQIAVNTI